MTRENVEQSAGGVKPFLVALLDKFPSFDPSWAPEQQANWFEAYGKLLEIGRNIPATGEIFATCAPPIPSDDDELSRTIEANARLLVQANIAPPVRREEKSESVDTTAMPIEQRKSPYGFATR